MTYYYDKIAFEIIMKNPSMIKYVDNTCTNFEIISNKAVELDPSLKNVVNQMMTDRKIKQLETQKSNFKVKILFIAYNIKSLLLKK